ncbi:MAG: aminotransferase class I/II-fold pyridoxal phosphate-dependent enzyme [Candidatus Riflebacteria bacterium]|nr:aminotransferase class I/II-fold pyridoxal phosphate-dependent enzyme [Candidatus Riflebacteria bacterium]
MKYKILLLDPNPVSLDISSRELGQRGLNIVGATTFDEACSHLREDGAIHVVLTEWELPFNTEAGSGRLEGSEMIRAFLKLRYEVNIFLLTDEKYAPNVTTGGLLNGYFYKGDRDWDDVVRKVRNEVTNSKNRAPFFEKLVEYANKAKDSWHTPGHASGFSIKSSPWVKDYYDFFGPNLFRSDVSVSVPMLDSLLHPTGIIKEAEELAARAFSARYTFFSTNGTSTSNKILLQTLLKPGDAILLDRNCHKSVHHGVVLAGAEPIYLMPSVNNVYGIFGPVPKKRIFEAMDGALAARKPVKALILTNCTYDGLTYDIAHIVQEAHQRGIKVIVDEAWYGYARFHPEFYPCAMEAGADYATQSTHKTMSAFSQASMIHVNDPDFEKIQDFFWENFNMHTSTSPQYPMIASLDAARKQMAMEGYGLLARTLELARSLREAINSLEKFRVLDLDDLISDELRNGIDKVRLDPTKLTIDVTKSGLSSREVERLLLGKHNIQIEKSTFNTLTVLITIGATYSKLNRLYLALANIESLCGNLADQPANGVLKDFRLSLSPIRFKPRYAFYCDGEPVPLRAGAGRVSTGMVTPYPPGIPLLVPGQVITEEIVAALQMYRDHHVEIHGLNEGLVKVMTVEEEASLVRRGFEIKDNRTG